MNNSKDIKTWYRENVLRKVQSVNIKNDNYIISHFKSIDEIKQESETLRHALYYIVSSFYKTNSIKYYPLYLRKSANPDEPYCSFAVSLINGKLIIANDSMGHEEIVMRNNLPLKLGNPDAYEFLMQHLDSLADVLEKESGDVNDSM